MPGFKEFYGSFGSLLYKPMFKRIVQIRVNLYE